MEYRLSRGVSACREAELARWTSRPVISVVICSRGPVFRGIVETSIRATIGCEFELLVIDNSENRYSIAEAYNRGLQQSVHDVVVFVHDDVRFCSRDWGLVLLGIFHDSGDIGIVGVAGAKIKTRTASAWWDCSAEHLVLNVIQHYPAAPARHVLAGFDRASEVEVVVVDGLFVALRKDGRIRFNESLGGFHNYDLGIAVDYQTCGYRIVATSRIVMEHFSSGTVDRAWTRSAVEFQGLYRHQLPMTVAGIPMTRLQEGLACAEFVKHCLRCGDTLNAIRYWGKLFLYGWFPRYHLDILAVAWHHKSLHGRQMVS